MKKIKYIFPLVFLSVLLQGCYKDKGNYTYRDKPEFSIEFPRYSYTTKTLSDPLVIQPVIHTDLQDDQLSFLWTVFITYETTDYSEVNVDVDTVSREKNLNWVVPLGAGTYHLVLRVEENATGMQYFQRAGLTVTTEFARGFYVLKESGGNCDLDLFYLADGDDGPQEPIYNCVEGKNGYPMTGVPVSFNIVYDYSFLNNETGEYNTTRSLNVCTEDDIWVINSLDMNVVYNHGSLFYGDVPFENPIAIVDNYFAVCYFSDLGHYYSYQAPQNAPAIEGAGKMGMLTNPDDKGMRIHPHAFYLPNYPSGATYYGGVYFFDEENGRFGTVNYDGTPMIYNNTGGLDGYPPTGISHKMLYYGGSNIANTFNTWAVFQDEADATTRYLYKLEVAFGNTNNPVREVTVVGGDKLFSKATHYANNETSALVMYFVYDNKLYMYNTVSGYEEVIHPSQIGADEEITYISHRWCGINEDDTFNYLAIATTIGGNYKVYLYNMDAGGRIASTPDRVLEGVGKVFKMNFVSDHLHMTSLGFCSWGF